MKQHTFFLTFTVCKTKNKVAHQQCTRTNIFVSENKSGKESDSVGSESGKESNRLEENIGQELH